MPLYTHFTERFKAARPLLDGLQANYSHWKALAAAARMSASGAAQPAPAAAPAQSPAEPATAS